MATNTTTVVGNLMDLAKFRLPDGSPIRRVINTLHEIDHWTQDMPQIGANQGLTHHILRTIKLPTGYLADVGGSWKSSKAEFEPAVAGLATIRSSYEAPADTYEYYEEAVGRMQLQAQLDAHIMALNQTVTNLLLEGTSVPNQSAIVGLMKTPPYTTYDNKFTFSAGGTGSDLTSAWLMKPGIDTIHGIFNSNHPTLGVEQKEMPISKVTGLGTGGDEHRWDITVENRIIKGLAIEDMTACKRICNIACGTSDYPGEDVVRLAIDASIINATKRPGMGASMDAEPDVLNTWMLYLAERLYAKMVHAGNNKTFVYTSDANIYRTKLPMIGDNIILRRMDALNHDIGSGESSVSAAS